MIDLAGEIVHPEKCAGTKEVDGAGDRARGVVQRE